MSLRWHNKRCSTEGIRIMEDAVNRVEQRLAESAPESNSGTFHIPTAINDELYEQCICVVVTPNASEGCCFRGMECTQFQIKDKIYNIGIVLKKHIKDNPAAKPVINSVEPTLEENQSLTVEDTSTNQ